MNFAALIAKSEVLKSIGQALAPGNAAAKERAVAQTGVGNTDVHCRLTSRSQHKKALGMVSKRSIGERLAAEGTKVAMKANA